MRLEACKIFGFKSFADKAELIFKPGVTAIVGPNGCGKSNITDAIRWVFGEQSAKSLRCGQMEDVIFNGSSCRKPLGMAEVSLKLTNLGALSVPYHEVVITRRIFRSGDTEYFINKNACRLKDITELFLDTGLGKGAYSIIEQGKIDFIITAKPKERRFLIESAAGILKYKARKEDAEKKIQGTLHNLERLEDILREVEKQKDILSSQAEQARRYQNYKNQEESLLKKIALGQLSLLNAQEKELKEELEEWQDRQVALNKDISFYDNELENTRASLLQNEEKISSFQKRVYAFENNLNFVNQQKEACVKEIERLVEEEKNTKEDYEEFVSAQKQLEKDILDTEELLLEKEKIFSQKRKELDLIEKEWEIIQKNILQKRQRQKIQTQDMVGFTNQCSRLTHLCESLKEKQKGLANRQIGLGKIITSLEEKIEKKSIEKKRFQSQIEEQKIVLRGYRSQGVILSETIKNLNRDLENILGEIKEIDKRLSTEKSKFDSLEEIFQKKEGYQEGVRHLLVASKENQEEIIGLQGIMAEIISVPQEFETAIEAVLEENIQCLLVDTHEHALAIIAHLKREKIGKGSFIVLERFAGFDAEQMKNEKSLKPASFLTPAIDIIDCEDKYRKIIKYLFKNTFIIKGIEKAGEILEGQSGWYKLVSLDGEIVTSYGFISGGVKVKRNSGLLARKRQMRELKFSISELEYNSLQQEQKRKELHSQIVSLKREREDSQKNEHETELFLHGVEKDFFHSQKAIGQDKLKLQEVHYKKERLVADGVELEKDIKEQSAKFASYQAKKQQAEEIGQSLAGELEELTQQEREIQNKLTQFKITLTSLQENKKALKVNLQRFKESHLSASRKLDHFQQRLKKIYENEQEKDRLFIDLEKRIPLLEEERNQAIKEIDQVELLRYQELESIKKMERDLKKSRKEQNKIDARIKEIEICAKEIELRKNYILENSSLLFNENELEEETSITEAQISEFQKEIQRIKEKLLSLGAVNLMAIKEYDQILERYEFLGNQKDDMIDSLSSLNSLIEKINTNSSSRFKETYEIINTNFQLMFKRLFNGGYAELFLDQPGDYLQTGIEVKVQPPGKNLQYLSLLSGGEKAMTAIALIFAIYLLKPSPFCLLDEIDAPLDEVNIDRFISLLNEFKQKTQFLMITHNKKTMQMANVIYGITMEKPGLSKVLSLDFKKVI